jgi:putative ABC transport system substrate-binding protein
MDRRKFVALIGGAIVAPWAWAQAPQKVARIGVLNAGTPEAGVASRAAFVEGMKAYGWVEQRNLMIDERYANSRLEDLPRLAAELLGAKPDVVVCNGPAPALAFKSLGSTLPVVFAAVADPIGIGLAKSLSRPEGNFTGLATLAPEFMLAKQVQLLREIVRGASRIAYLTNPGNPVHIQGRDLRLKVAREQGLEAIEVQAKTREDLESAFAEVARRKADVMYLSGDPLPMEHRKLVADLALRHRLPVMFLFYQHVEAGGLVSYGTDTADFSRRAASYVDKILKGAAPRDLPIEEPTKYMLVINMKTAKALGIKIPQTVLIRADRVIE